MLHVYVVTTGVNIRKPHEHNFAQWLSGYCIFLLLLFSSDAAPTTTLDPVQPETSSQPCEPLIAASGSACKWKISSCVCEYSMLSSLVIQ